MQAAHAQDTSNLPSGRVRGQQDEEEDPGDDETHHLGGEAGCPETLCHFCFQALGFFFLALQEAALGVHICENCGLQQLPDDDISRWEGVHAKNRNGKDVKRGIIVLDPRHFGTASSRGRLAVPENFYKEMFGLRPQGVHRGLELVVRQRLTSCPAPGRFMLSIEQPLACHSVPQRPTHHADVTAQANVGKDAPTF